MILVHVLNSSGELTFLEPSIRVLSNNAISQVKKKIPVDGVDLVYYSWAIELYLKLGLGDTQKTAIG